MLELRKAVFASKYLKKLPTAICGEALAIASVGNLLSVYSSVFRVFCGIISASLLFCFTLKMFFCREHFADEIRDINVLSIFPTYFMGFMVLSTYIPVSLSGISIGAIFCAVAFAGHLSVTLFFSWRHLRHVSANTIMPNWFIVYVAYALGGIFASYYGFFTIGKGIVVVALASYSVLFPMVFYRLLVVGRVPDKLLPAIWLVNSPINICIVAYIASFPVINGRFLVVLLFISILSFVTSVWYVDIRRVLRDGFAPTWSAFTFPSIIFVVAMQNAVNYFYGGKVHLYVALFFAGLEIAVAAIVFFILLLFLRYLRIQAPEVIANDDV